MNKFDTISTHTTSTATSWTKTLGIDFLTQTYSDLLEQPISTKQTLHLLHTQAAAFITFCSFASNIAIISLCMLWFGAALWQCGQSFKMRAKR